ncbi:hypothetical protein NXW11_00595 [Bacteroides thetaiotaomicron]|uniref:hypothetical protein n=1 Tax=Bacteroides thetaiotaomicron TaxID=818 RepID=UPI002165B12F|nr:hypothetical protein [Bacteroides thetaiotaomicron]MCS2616474.1 hypothetical protein [Bacteroides thetaiotaomicron]
MNIHVHLNLPSKWIDFTSESGFAGALVCNAGAAKRPQTLPTDSFTTHYCNNNLQIMVR